MILADIDVPFERPRDLKRDYASAREIMDQIWRLLDAPVEVGS
jgi:hypothetical protein